jgi:hypothetical protein
MHTMLANAAGCRERFARIGSLRQLHHPDCVSVDRNAPGVIMLKIDGLSRHQFQRALDHGRLPYLARLLAGGRYTLKLFYAGVPSTTPVVQAELFFGVRTSAPAITFYDREEQKMHNLLMPSSAEALARKLEKRGRPLLAGGRSYSNIFTGGAAEARYCVQTMRLRSLVHILSSIRLGVLLALQPHKLLPMIGDGLLEAALALADFFDGVAGGKNLFKELKFVPTRVLVSILLRELIRTRVKMDVARGVPIVHASFLGYDEHAHRRGPGSAFAHWSLKGIDEAIREIHRAARRSCCRPYRLVVYADHGQETVLPYRKYAGIDLEEAVKRAIHSTAGNGVSRGSQSHRQGTHGNGTAKQEQLSADGAHITALGPLGHIYLNDSRNTSTVKEVAEALIRVAKIPLVMYTSGNNVVALTRREALCLEAAPRAVLGSDHPFARWAAEDLAAACRHPQAGDIVISGWRPNEPPLTFAFENGAHGGPGREETRAFILMPQEMATPAAALRPGDLRQAVLGLRETGGSAQQAE